MKKFAAIALAASMVLGLSGCGSSGSAQTSDTATAELPIMKHTIPSVFLIFSMIQKISIIRWIPRK